MSFLSVLKKIVRNNWLIFSALLITSLLAVNIWFTLNNNRIIDRNYLLQKQTEDAKLATQRILYGTMHGLDLGVRGFGLTKDKTLLNPYEKAIQESDSIFMNIRAIAKLHQYADFQAFKGLEYQVKEYIQLSKDMVVLAEKDSMAAFTNLLKQDRGFGVWKQYVSFAEPFFKFEDRIKQQAQTEYQAAMQRNVFLQIILVLITLPTLSYILHRVKSEAKNRKALLVRMEKHNQTHLFYSGAAEDKVLTQDILEDSIANIEKASRFVKEIAKGNYDAVWEGMNQSLVELNKNTLAGELHQMKNQMKTVKEEEQKRNWVNEGIYQLGETLRREASLAVLTDSILAKLVKYLGANQGGLFIVNETKPDEPYMELKATYAYDRKKYANKQIILGEGLAGQAWQEGETVYLSDIPQDYVRITSGLGEARPANLLIVPLKHDQNIQGVLELASFRIFHAHEIAFVEKVAENMAATFASAKVAERTNHLLHETRQMTEILRVKEEEMRQNVEELMATQEEMRRKEQEYLHLIAQLENKSQNMQNA